MPHDCSSGEDTGVKTVLGSFFLEYSQNKTKHQDEICNSLVLLCLQELQSGLLCIVDGLIALDAHTDEVLKSEFRVKMKFSLSLCGDVHSALAKSLQVNLQAEANTCVTVGHCLRWIKSFS